MVPHPPTARGRRRGGCVLLGAASESIRGVADSEAATMPFCSYGGHRVAATPGVLYYAAPGLDRFTGDRYRSRLCHRHTRALLTQLLRCGLDLESEGPEPEFCVGCGAPTADVTLEISLYEGDFSVRVATVACQGCDASGPQIVAEPLRGAEKLPPREKSTVRSLPKRRVS